MLRSDKFYEALTDAIQSVSFKPNRIKKDITELNNKYGIPKGLLTNYLTMRDPIDDASDFVLYALASFYLKPGDYESVFSLQEIKYYKNYKYEEGQIQFPLIFDMTQINSSQWIGKITVQQLMKLRDAQMINYNERTQRTLERKVNRGGFEYYRIAINETAVRQIEESYENNSFISNTITLNLSDESEVDYVYDPERHQLIIKSIKFFDILDGYHRYRAMSKACLKDNTFDYEMELRIVAFDEREAKQFIWQEDQKTKMNRIDSNAYNQNDMSVAIAEKLSKGLQAGLISRNKSIIDLTQLSIAIRYGYNTKQIKTVGEAGAIAKEIKGKVDYLIEEAPEMFDSKWDKDQIFNMIVTFVNQEDHYAAMIKRLNEYTKRIKYWESNPSLRKFSKLYDECEGGKRK